MLVCGLEVIHGNSSSKNVQLLLLQFSFSGEIFNLAFISREREFMSHCSQEHAVMHEAIISMEYKILFISLQL